jgi:hypothetical protein
MSRLDETADDVGDDRNDYTAARPWTEVDSDVGVGRAEADFKGIGDGGFDQ